MHLTNKKDEIKLGTVEIKENGHLILKSLSQIKHCADITLVGNQNAAHLIGK